MKYTCNDPKLKPRRKELRHNQTEPERILWNKLKNKRLAGYKFFRQYSIDHYILDFYCPRAKLGIELDGSHHAEDEIAEYDRIRTIHIESHGIKILRFWNSDIHTRLQDVLEAISYQLEIRSKLI
jgi:very-short-patch-repair endonuclease